MYCQCGCGQKTKRMSKTATGEGYKKGEYRRFIRFHHQRVIKNFKNKMFKHKGYIYLYAPEHPNPTQGKYIKRSRLTIENHIGRYLKSTEQIHHINGIKDDDRIENLQIVTLSEHNSIHYKDKSKNMCNGRFCHAC